MLFKDFRFFFYLILEYYSKHDVYGKLSPRSFIVALANVNSRYKYSLGITEWDDDATPMKCGKRLVYGENNRCLNKSKDSIKEEAKYVYMYINNRYIHLHKVSTRL